MENNNQNFEQQYQPEAQPQQNFNQQPQYIPEPYAFGEPPAPVMSVKDWLLTLLVMLVPCVNIIMMFVWAFSKNENPNKSNYFKAYLIYNAISIVIGVLIGIAYVAVFASAFSGMTGYM